MVFFPIMDNAAGVQVLMMKRAEIDTRPPFRSVKEAVSLFGEKVLAEELYAATKLKQVTHHPSISIPHNSSTLYQNLVPSFFKYIFVGFDIHSSFDLYLLAIYIHLPRGLCVHRMHACYFLISNVIHHLSFNFHHRKRLKYFVKVWIY